MKTITKKEWDAFWDDLGDDFHLEDCEISPEEDGDLMPGDIITIVYGGALGWQSLGPLLGSRFVGHPIAKPSDVDDDGALNLTLDTALRRWRKKQACLTLAVEIRKEDEADLRAWIKAHKGQVL